MTRVGIREEDIVTIARFMSGLSLEIRDIVELLPYRDFQVWYKFALKLNKKF